MPELNPPSQEQVQKWLGQKHSRLTRILNQLLPAPCPQHCNRIRGKTRFHLTCLTCPIRRHNNGDKNFKVYQRALMVLESASGKGFIMPTHYFSYGLFVRTDERGHVPLWKVAILKYLLSIAERIAEY